jgi:RNA polymerase sigma-70 factor (ECF subfamily)
MTASGQRPRVEVSGMLGGEFDTYLRAAIRGERDGVEHVLAAIRPLVLRYCRARLGVGYERGISADDVAQEVCLALLSALPRFQDQARPFLAYVYGIAAHKVVDAHRAAGRERAEPVAEPPEPRHGPKDPEGRLLAVEDAARMRRLLGTLSERQREVLILRVVHGLSAEQTARAVGSTASAVRVAQHRALNRLRTALNDERPTSATPREQPNQTDRSALCDADAA